MRTSARSTFFVVLLLTAMLLLTSCGSSEPSKSDVEKILGEQFAETLKVLNNIFGDKNAKTEQIPLTVRDLKCNKNGNDSYDCDVLISLDNKEIPARFRFTKLGGNWKAQEIK